MPALLRSKFVVRVPSRARSAGPKPKTLDGWPPKDYEAFNLKTA
jgi:hypothetical protein